MQEKDDARPPLPEHSLFPVTQDLGQQHQMVVVYPHDAVATTLLTASENNRSQQVTTDQNTSQCIKKDKR